MSMLVDTHCHLTDEKIPNIDTAISDAKRNSVNTFITVGTSIANNKQVVQLAQSNIGVYASIGVYPHEDLDADNIDIEREIISELATHGSKIVAIGECGIDFTTNYDPTLHRTLDKQLEIFELQAGIAEKNNLPLVVHNRNGDDYVLSVIKKYPRLYGVAHCFTQELEFARKLVDLGFYISFSGMLTYPKKTHLVDVANGLPRESIVLETDAPYLPPQSKRGSVNVPANIVETAQKLADIWQVSFDDVCDITTQNAAKLFKLEDIC